MISVKPIANRSRSSYWRELRQILSGDVISVRCAISYVMRSGSAVVSGEVDRLIKAGCAIDVVFGDDFKLSESAALRHLIDLGCDLWLFTSEVHPNYHPKLWIVDYRDGTRTVVIGSANLSRAGLMANAEAG